ncbi:hypothetical protein C0581_01745 [Candidatus Parcubacteria bacterium]|nr:MAG: hypothetical protein C0581_01745 [Candidatus Parcubacteria bacterium]
MDKRETLLNRMLASKVEAENTPREVVEEKPEPETAQTYFVAKQGRDSIENRLFFGKEEGAEEKIERIRSVFEKLMEYRTQEELDEAIEGFNKMRQDIFGNEPIDWKILTALTDWTSDFWRGNGKTHFGNMNLSKIDFGGEDLEYANLTGADVSFSNLADIRMTAIKLRDANARGASFRDSTLGRMADFTGAQLEGATFEGASFKGNHISIEEGLVPKGLSDRVTFDLAKHPRLIYLKDK